MAKEAFHKYLSEINPSGTGEAYLRRDVSKDMHRAPGDFLLKR